MRRTWALLTTTALAAGLGSAVVPAGASTPTAARPATAAMTPAATAPATSAPVADRGYTPPPIAWGACDDATLQAFGAQCGRLIVPLDYKKPRGRTISLSVSRVLHTTPAADYQGVMLVNPGGPGGSGRIYSILQGFVPNGAGASYDWIGFDPRGVGDSSPSLSCDRFFNKGDRPPYRPTKKRYLNRWVARSQAYSRACTKAPGHRLFDHVKTIDSVKDMNSLRKALGQRRINFYGFSYGTYLGQVFATKYPRKVRRFVFDGTVDPRRVFYKSNQDQDRAFQKTFNIYFRWLAKYSDVYHVGSTRKQVRRSYLQAVKRLDRNAAGGVLGGDELTDVLTSAGYYVYGWEDIGQAFSTYVNTGDATALIALYGENTAPGADNGYAMYLGTQCTDARWPQSQRRLNRDNNRLYRNGATYFTWANAWFNGPCASWRYKASKPVKVKGKRIDHPILMIGETYDAATPFKGSLVVRRLFPQARLIEGVGGSTHAGSLSGIACTDDAIAAYLADGTIFPRLKGRRADKSCSPVPQPDPTSTNRTKLTKRERVLLSLHEELGRLR